MDKLAIILFNERVERLNRCKLAKRMEENPHYTLNYDLMMKRQWISIDGVTEDDVDALVLNIRPLIQDNDGYSIRCLAESVYQNSNAPNDLSTKFIEQRKKWCDYMQSPSIIAHFQENRNFTNGELFNIILYGGLAHSNRDYVKLFYNLTLRGAFSSIVCGWFLSSLRIFIGVVREIYKINKELLEQQED
jgi:hypothetical protein